MRSFIRYEYSIINRSGKVVYFDSGNNMRVLDERLSKFFTRSRSPYRCEKEYKYRFFITYIDTDLKSSRLELSIHEYFELFLLDYRVGNIDI